MYSENQLFRAKRKVYLNLGKFLNSAHDYIFFHKICTVNSVKLQFLNVWRKLSSRRKKLNSTEHVVSEFFISNNMSKSTLLNKSLHLLIRYSDNGVHSSCKMHAKRATNIFCVSCGLLITYFSWNSVFLCRDLKYCILTYNHNQLINHRNF